MTPLVQELLAYLAVAVAAVWLARDAWRRRSGGSCDGCSPRSIAARARGRGVRPRGLRVLP